MIKTDGIAYNKEEEEENIFYLVQTLLQCFVVYVVSSLSTQANENVVTLVT